jgi:HKD family nuclease
MNLQLLGQGYEAESEYSVGKQLMKFLVDTDFNTFIGISAFASQAGVNGLGNFIAEAKNHLERIVIIVGVDQKATSKEALEALLALEIDAFVFYQPSFTIFHPKIYLFEGTERSELIVGSSNLTMQGLFMNVETSILVSVDNSSDSDSDIIEQVKTYFSGLFDYSDPNLQKLTQELIDLLVEQGIIPDEAQRKELQDKVEKTEKPDTENLLSTFFPKRSNTIVPPEFRRKRSRRTKHQGALEIPEAIANAPISLIGTNDDLELIWISKPLTERDLNVPKGGNTNPTGSMLFKKGALEEIDQRHYFRDVVFADLAWTHDLRPNSTHIERATAFFRFIILGVDCGEFELTLSHNTKTDSAAYLQKNSMTQISWGKAKSVVAKSELIGKICKLYAVSFDLTRFVFEIEEGIVD